ncbi:MAG: hypothetical protein QNJ73_02475 [Gammaproteobacteria bacterium]|nr:hypothetical protein [Gammaproteobacteria bacterium]
MTRTHRLCLWLLLISTISFAVPATSDQQHPLDSLTVAEYETVTRVLGTAGKIDKSSRFALVNLAQPEKESVLRWQPSDGIARQAFVAVRHQRQMYEGIVDLAAEKLLSWERVEGVQPALFDDEFVLSQTIVRRDPAWQEAIAKRGIENLKDVFCYPAFPGNFDRDWDVGNQRLGMIACYHTGSDNGLWGRPIEGLLAIVDYDNKALFELIDTGVVAIPNGGPAIAEPQPTANPARGPVTHRISTNGQWISWDRWRFHLGIDPRVGPVLSLVSFEDAGRERSVMYQGSVSELFVPYMDPTRTWYFRTYLDVGEYGIGASGVPLTAGRDCPADALMLDASFLNYRGKPTTTTGIACVFERLTGDAAWSHFEVRQQGSQMRRHAELVVRFIVWLGNYDYVLDWIFTETGSLKVRVGATGIVLTKAVASRLMSDAGAEADTAYARLIAPGLAGVNHDHFFSFRLDLDVDGPRNSLLIDRLRQVELDPADGEAPRRQIWQAFPAVARRESDAQLSMNLRQPALWRVINPSATNHVGNPVSYQLQPGKSARTLLDDGAIVHRRAAFTAHHLWATPYEPAERYAAGDYPNRHPGGAGLPEWTAANRSIQNTDIVLWYTAGMHHVVRAEDWPIMPLVHHEFELRPFDFFDFNPTVSESGP